MFSFCCYVCEFVSIEFIDLVLCFVGWVVLWCFVLDCDFGGFVVALLSVFEFGFGVALSLRLFDLWVWRIGY